MHARTADRRHRGQATPRRRHARRARVRGCCRPFILALRRRWSAIASTRSRGSPRRADRMDRSTSAALLLAAWHSSPSERGSKMRPAEAVSECARSSLGVTSWVVDRGCRVRRCAAGVGLILSLRANRSEVDEYRPRRATVRAVITRLWNATESFWDSLSAIHWSLTRDRDRLPRPQARLHERGVAGTFSQRRTPMRRSAGGRSSRRTSRASASTR